MVVFSIQIYMRSSTLAEPCYSSEHSLFEKYMIIRSDLLSSSPAYRSLSHTPNNSCGSLLNDQDGRLVLVAFFTSFPPIGKHNCIRFTFWMFLIEILQRVKLKNQVYVCLNAFKTLLFFQKTIFSVAQFVASRFHNNRWVPICSSSYRIASDSFNQKLQDYTGTAPGFAKQTLKKA